MNTTISFAAMLVAALLASTGVAVAEHRGTAAPAAGAGGSQNLENPSASIPDAPHRPGPGTQDFIGEVVKVDPESGTLVLSTERGLVAFQAPASALQGVNVGDLVRVRTAAQPIEQEPAASPKTEPGDRPASETPTKPDDSTKPSTK
jgi:hypothetical protein